MRALSLIQIMRSLIILLLGFYKFTDCYEIQSSAVNWLTSKFCSFLWITSASLTSKDSQRTQCWPMRSNQESAGLWGKVSAFLILVPPCLPSSCLGKLSTGGTWLQLARFCLGSLVSQTSNCTTHHHTSSNGTGNPARSGPYTPSLTF